MSNDIITELLRLAQSAVMVLGVYLQVRSSCAATSAPGRKQP